MENKIDIEKFYNMIFDDIEKFVHDYICEMGRQMTQTIIDYLDVETMNNRNKKRYKMKGLYKTNIKTIYGEVQFTKRMYYDELKEEDVYLLEEMTEMKTVGQMLLNTDSKIKEEKLNISYQKNATSTLNVAKQDISYKELHWNSFEDMERAIYEYVCQVGQEITIYILRELDMHIKNNRDKCIYKYKQTRRTTIKTVYGEVKYNRTQYYNTLKKEYVYLLDEKMKLKRVGMISTNLVKQIANTIVNMPYRKAAEVISKTTGQAISSHGVWNITQKIGRDIQDKGEQFLQENHSSSLITTRMKGYKMRWSVVGENNLLKLIYMKENGELDRLIEGEDAVIELSELVDAKGVLGSLKI